MSHELELRRGRRPARPPRRGHRGGLPGRLEVLESRRLLSSSTTDASSVADGSPALVAAMDDPDTMASLTGTTVDLATSSASAQDGQTVTLTATVAAAEGSGTPSGTVTFLDGPAPLATVALDAVGRAALTAALPIGDHAITAVYNGDANFSANISNTVAETVTPTPPAPTGTTVDLATSSASAQDGQTVTLTATVAAAEGSGTPSGTVTFLDGPAPLAVVPLDAAGRAVLRTALPVGDHAISAIYSGDARFAPSGSGPLAESVSPAPTPATNPAPTPATAHDVTSSFVLRFGTIERIGRHVLVPVTLHNRGARSVAGPVLLALDGLRKGVALRNAAGVTRAAPRAGSPFVVVSFGGLGPGGHASVMLDLVFGRRASHPLFTPRVLSGTLLA
jgi:hypothetical protein